MDASPGSPRSSPLRRSIVIDTDPGQDDAVALLLALASPELDVLGVTTVAGNVPLNLTTRNARCVLELAGRPDIAVYAGAARPMVRLLTTAEHVHGRSGLDGPIFPEPKIPIAGEAAVDFLVRTLRERRPGEVTICALGPLTNIATALVQAPDIAARVAQVVLMGGGCFEGGNITPAAEFNVFVDPHAAAIVLRSGVPVVMIPLDVTHSVLATPERLKSIRDLGNRCGLAVVKMLEFSERFDVEKYQSGGAPLHDPCVIAYLLEPGLFRGRYINIEIETESELTIGMTVADWWRVSGRLPNATFMRHLNADRFFGLLTERIARLP